MSSRPSTGSRSADVWINGGFFVFRRAIFDVIEPGDELVDQPFARLIERGELLAYRYEGFWEPMDTIKDKQKLDALVRERRRPVAGRRRAAGLSHAVSANGQEGRPVATGDGAALTADDVVAGDLRRILDATSTEFRALAGKRLLLTGGAGFLGYYLVQAVLALERRGR